MEIIFNMSSEADDMMMMRNETKRKKDYLCSLEKRGERREKMTRDEMKRSDVM